MIKKVYSNRHHPGWRYDARTKQYSSWSFDIRRSNGRRLRASGFLNRAEAEAVIAKIRQDEKEHRYGVSLEPKAVPTVRELAGKHIERITDRREVVRSRRVLHTLCAELFEGFKVDELLSSHLQKFIERRQGDGLKPSSINRELNIISAMLHAAPEYYPGLLGWVPPRIPRPRQSKRGRERVITASEITKVLTWLYEPQREGETASQAANRRNVGHVFRTALLTGARKGELCKATWDHVDWGAMVLQIVGTKTEHRSAQTVRYLKITDTLAEILRERLASSTGPYVFSRSGKEITDYYEIMAEACDAVSVAYGREVSGGFVTHDARHTAVTRMLQAGSDLATIGSITGHADKTLILHYGHASTESKDRAMDVLENFAGNEGAGHSLDAGNSDAAIYRANNRNLVPEVGLEPT